MVWKHISRILKPSDNLWLRENHSGMETFENDITTLQGGLRENHSGMETAMKNRSVVFYRLVA